MSCLFDATINVSHSVTPQSHKVFWGECRECEPLTAFPQCGLAGAPGGSWQMELQVSVLLPRVFETTWSVFIVPIFHGLPESLS